MGRQSGGGRGSDPGHGGRGRGLALAPSEHDQAIRDQAIRDIAIRDRDLYDRAIREMKAYSDMMQEEQQKAKEEGAASLEATSKGYRGELQGGDPRRPTAWPPGAG